MRLAPLLVGFLALLMVSAPAVADDLDVEVVNGDLRIPGDADGNVLTIDDRELDVNALRITPGGTTIVNGSPDPFVATGVTRDVIVMLGDGANHLTMIFVTVADRLRVRTGGGDDLVRFMGTSVLGHTQLSLGSGENAITLEFDSFVGGLAVKTSDGDDILASSGSFSGDPFR